MQIVPGTDVAELFDRLVEDQVPGRRGLEAWVSLLRAHATLMRRLDTDLERETGLALADFDVLAQLAAAHGELRMTELAARPPGSPRAASRRTPRPGGCAPRGRLGRGAPSTTACPVPRTWASAHPPPSERATGKLHSSWRGTGDRNRSDKTPAWGP